MSRSQRHKVVIQATDSDGKGLAEKQPASPFIIQYANSQAFSVPVGPSGGPLQGSSMAGYPPTLIPAPGLLTERADELSAEGDFESPGQFDLSGNPVHTSLPAPEDSGGAPGPGPEPEPGLEPTLTSIDPDTAELGSADVTLHCHGTNFTDTSVVYFANQSEPAVFVSDTELTTIVKPSLGWGAVPVDVWVQQGSVETAHLAFTFTEAAPLAAGPLVPPFNIIRIEDDVDGIALIMPAGTGIHVGDTVLIEASFDSNINGSYPVLAVKGTRIIVDNPYALAAPIEGKGRVTVTSGA